MPRKRRRTAWSAAAESTPLAYAPHHTVMTLRPDGAYSIALFTPTPTSLPRPPEPIHDFACPRDLPSSPHDHVADPSFASDHDTPPRKPHTASDPIDDSPPAAVLPPPAVPTRRSEKARQELPTDEHTPSRKPASAPKTPSTTYVARSLLSAMNQVGSIAPLDLAMLDLPPTPDPPPLATPDDLPLLSRKTVSVEPSPTSNTQYTPLMLNGSAVRRAQKCLGITPDTPGRSRVLYMDPSIERELRAVQLSTHKMNLSGDVASMGSAASRPEVPCVTPEDGDSARSVGDARAASLGETGLGKMEGTNTGRATREEDSASARANRRLSGMSTVTPIPLKLEFPIQPSDVRMVGPHQSPQKDIQTPPSAAQVSIAEREPSNVQPEAPAFKRLASPITPLVKRNDCTTSIIPESPAEEKSTRTAPALKQPQGVASLFTTGKGTPLNMSSNSARLNLFPVNAKPFKTPRKGSAGPSLFTTASGKRVDIPEAASLLREPKGPENALFTTGSGRSVDILGNSRKEGSTLKPFDVAALFSSAKQAPSSAREGFGDSDTLKTPSSKRTPLRETRDLRRLLFDGNSVLTDSHSKGVNRTVHRASKVTSDIVRRPTRLKPGLKSTPFKRPRQVMRTPGSADKHVASKLLIPHPVPNLGFPRILANGHLACDKPEHVCGLAETTSSKVLLPDYMLKVDCLRRCSELVFQGGTMGDIDCLPRELGELLQRGGTAEFKLDTCVAWVRTYFPSVSEKPATCVGSASWTSLSYSLAVWKLGKLDLRRNSNSEITPVFLTAANVVREILRRISYEWHNNKQPHLLRMMRRDSSPASHAVLLVAGIEENSTEDLVLLLSDGWYVTRGVIDDTLQKRVKFGKLRVGDKVHIAGAGLEASQRSSKFFFGEGDELGSSVLKLSANNVRKRLHAPNETLGIQRKPMLARSTKWIKDDAGQCPTTKVIILRSFPIFYMETVVDDNDESDRAARFVFRREDAEDEERSAHQDRVRRKIAAALEQKRKSGLTDDTPTPGTADRNVRPVKEILACGCDDDPADPRARKAIRVYSPSEEVQACLSQEGRYALLANLWPKKNSWSCKSEAVIPPGKSASSCKDLSASYPRRPCSILELQKGELKSSEEFDGVFCLLHVSVSPSEGSQRFVYFADEVGDEIRVLAMELSGSDTTCLPRALRSNGRTRTKFPIVVLKDVQFLAVSRKHDLVHSRATLRTSFISSKAFSRQRGKNPLSEILGRVECDLKGKLTQLEILREAVISFAAGARGSIGAYFTSTQDT